MKRLMTLLLALTMVFCLAACSEDPAGTSSAPATSSEAPATSSEVETSSEAPESSVTEESSEAEPSEDSSVEESSEPELDYEVAENISQFINWKSTIGKGAVGNSAKDDQAIQLTALNKGVVDGVAGIHGFNADYEEYTIESADGTYDEYAVYVFEYNHDLWGYALSASYGLDATDKDSIEIPADGYVVAIHAHFEAAITAANGLDNTTVVTPYGFRGTDAADAIISTGTATIDGNISVEEYGEAVWVLEPDSEIVSYEQFDNKGVESYYSTATVYMMYDNDNLYLAVVVDSPYHFCKLDQANAGNMWSQECIQVNVTPIAPNSEFYLDNDYWDWNNPGSQSVAETTTKNLMRQYGFSVNSETGEMINCLWQGDKERLNPTFHVARVAQQTIYEVAIPWSELGAADAPFTPEAGMDIGVSLSINSGRAADDFMNYYLRDGGGVIGRNDWTKIPVITLD